MRPLFRRLLTIHQRWIEAEADADAALELGLENSKVFYHRAWRDRYKGTYAVLKKVVPPLPIVNDALITAASDIAQLTRLDEKTGKQLSQG